MSEEKKKNKPKKEKYSIWLWSGYEAEFIQHLEDARAKGISNTRFMNAWMKGLEILEKHRQLERQRQRPSNSKLGPKLIEILMQHGSEADKKFALNLAYDKFEKMTGEKLSWRKAKLSDNYNSRTE